MILVKFEGYALIELPNLNPSPRVHDGVIEWAHDVQYVDVDVPKHGRYRFSACEIKKWCGGRYKQVGAGSVTYRYMSRVDRAIRMARSRRFI